MYYSCHCIKRNGLQHDCRRTGCGGEPACLHLPDPLCAPSQLARARGLADAGSLAGHLNSNDGGSGGPGAAHSGGGSGKRFIVCELKGISPDIATDKSGKCCKCNPVVTPPKPGVGMCCKCPTSPPPMAPPKTATGVKPVLPAACVFAGVPVAKPPTFSSDPNKKCPCQSGTSSSAAERQGVFAFDENTINKILSSFDKKDVSDFDDDVFIGPGGRPRKLKKPVVKEPCTREGCVHWQPPPPCVWDAPCKADCFETPPGIKPGRNPLTRGGGYGGCVMEGTDGRHAAAPGPQQQQHQQQRQKMIMLTPDCCAGCCSSSGGAAAAGAGAPAAGMPVLVMKLC